MHYDCYYSRINQGEVRAALQKMGRNKAIFSSAKMPDEWRLSEVIPIYKNKGDAQACSNYRKLLSHTMKLWERVIERRLRRKTRVLDNQFGFMPGRPTSEAIHLLRSLMEKYRERQRDLHIAFLDLEKAYDSVPRELVWKTLLDKGTPRRYSRVIKDMYEGAKTRVRTTVGNTEYFPVEVGLHQGSAISPYLFTLILDELSRGIQENIPWCMIFADDIVLIAESAEGLNNRLESWRKALEDNGLRVSREKTEYLRCDFGRYEVVHQEMDIHIGDQILQPKESFRYLGSVLHRSGRIDDDVAHRIRAGWMKWRAASGVLCDRRIPLKIKGKFYRAAIRPAMLYGSECWPITKALANKVEVAELRMLRAELDVDSIIDKMREGRLRWFGHVKRRPQTAPVRRVEALVVEGSRRRGRPKLRWEDRLKMDMKELRLSEDMTSDRNAWRDRIRISG
ncbi:retrovirus-related pol polyprotein LINE-1 [Tanacetum coccineum]|uniref:Retrovirus-related pol polyprotein LINE-1 n=1 Tax=Tanacetum coccineum TaxID=301880 RepID=A0ABQ5FQK8_9ASTR